LANCTKINKLGGSCKEQKAKRVMRLSGGAARGSSVMVGCSGYDYGFWKATPGKINFYEEGHAAGVRGRI
jgi:hypothetical protein